MLRWFGLSVCWSFVWAGCADPPEAPPTPGMAPANSAEDQARAQAEVRARLEAEHSACRAMRTNVESVPALAGTPKLDEQRHRVLGRAKGWPVVFRRRPASDLGKLQPYFRTLAEALDDPRRVFATLKTLRGLTRFQRKQVREILLPEGYFYAEEPQLARWAVLRFELQTFFDEPEIWLMRGSDVHRLVRSEEGYRHADGPEEGQLASLLLFDRVVTKRAELFPTLHIDLVPSAEAHGFDRVRIERITPVGINAKVRYGARGPWVDAVFTDDEGKAQLACEIVSVEESDSVRMHRDEHQVHAAAAERLRRAAADQVRERLMFDEPREEEGQQDGSLRPQWLWAYKRGGTGYSFNQVWYPVFDQQGRPHPPQVCIDFVLDTYERASGTWFRGREDPRERVIGRVDFERLEIPNRRSVEAVADYFRETPGTFDIWDLDPQQRVRFVEYDKFFDFLREHADRFRVNSVVLIHGPRGREAHYHSFIVSRADPVTGMPVEVMENAGKPRFRAWEAAMQSGPLRSIKHVMIPRTSWLREAYAAEAGTIARADGPPSDTAVR